MFNKFFSILLLLIAAVASPIRPRSIRSVVGNPFLNGTNVNITSPPVATSTVSAVAVAVLSPIVSSLVLSDVTSAVSTVEPVAPSFVPSVVASDVLLDVLHRTAADGAREGIAMVLKSYNASGWCAVEQSSWCPQTISSTIDTIVADSVNALDIDADRCDEACILESMCKVTSNSTMVAIRSGDVLLRQGNQTALSQYYEHVRQALLSLSQDDCVVTNREELHQALATFQANDTSDASPSSTISSDTPSIPSDSSQTQSVPVHKDTTDTPESYVQEQTPHDHGKQHSDNEDDDDDHLGAILGSTLGGGAALSLGSLAANHIATGPGPSLLSRLFGAISGGVSRFIPGATSTAGLLTKFGRGSTLLPTFPPQVPVTGKVGPYDAQPPLELIPEQVEPPYVAPPHFTGPSPPVDLPFGATGPDLVPPPPIAPLAPAPPLPPTPVNPWEAVAQHQPHDLETIPEDSPLDFTQPGDSSSESSIDYDDYNSDGFSDGSGDSLRPLRGSDSSDSLSSLEGGEYVDTLRPLRPSGPSISGIRPGDLQVPPVQNIWPNPPAVEPPVNWGQPPGADPPTVQPPQHRPIRPSDYNEGTNELYGATEASENLYGGSENSEDLFRGSEDSDPIFEPSDLLPSPGGLSPFPQGPPAVGPPTVPPFDVPSFPINPPLEPLSGAGPPPEPAPPSSSSESLSEPQPDSPPSEPASESQSEPSLDDTASEPLSPIDSASDLPIEPDSPSPGHQPATPDAVPESPVEAPPSAPAAPVQPHLFEGPPKYRVFENKYSKETLLSITSEAEVADIYSKAGATFSNNKQLPYKLLDANNRPIKNVWRDPGTLTQLPGTVEEIDGRFLQKLPEVEGVAEMPPWAAAQATPAPVPTLPEGMTYDEAYPQAYAPAGEPTDSASYEPIDDPSNYKPVDDPAHDNTIDALDAEFEDYQHETQWGENHNDNCFAVNPFTECGPHVSNVDQFLHPVVDPIRVDDYQRDELSSAEMQAHSNTPRVDTIEKPPTLGQVAGAVLPAVLPLGGAAAVGRLGEVAELANVGRLGRLGRIGRPPGGIEYDPEIFTGEYLPAYSGGGRD